MSDVAKSQIVKPSKIDDMVETAKNSNGNEEADECEYDMTPSQARQISYDGHSATEPERGSKK